MKIREIHQIELTSRCNLRCFYCVHPKMPRPKQDMTLEVFEKTLELVRYFIRKGTQIHLNMAGIGESTMHPDFKNFLRLARLSIGRLPMVIATNGIEIVKNPEIAEWLLEYRCAAFVSLHRPEMAGRAIEILKSKGVYAGSSSDPSLNSVDWAGQVKWHVSSDAKDGPCAWLNNGQAFVMSDGRISTCSFDGSGAGVIGTIYDDVEYMELNPYSLCCTCHLDSGIRIPLKEVV